ncbi:cytochrome c biogenesis protein ResB [Alkalibacillus haloalkaliphilus]|uniref:cytochrome c biogenesis protein ResB n=1 Tax=Alkalibacillus haloalkaliphilus TaxID=94136 RepID=UPI002936832A|nr:cytochrome c biogenesis protein ResB [Alkalibacillus haloalkaliphilus]MDV2580860.1 cytochrome c biogenesis protein ResB [Alkalibacillus haloalkaliphilus]
MSDQSIRCECGHLNKEGTILCEACGKPIEGNQHIDGNDEKHVLEMRYEGSARRSQTYKRTFVDKTWGFFSSVKVGVWLIVITVVLSALGTVYPQEQFKNSPLPSSQFYVEEYGLTGQIFYQLGFHNMYSSWWYITLVALIGVSIIIASIDRYVPLRRALNNQKTKRHEVFVKRQRLVSKDNELNEDGVNKLKENLKSRRYKVYEDDGHVMAEKNRFSRWGPYVNHIGLIIILLASIFRMFEVMHVDDYVWVREGETRVIPSTNQEYYVENTGFVYEEYDPETQQQFSRALEDVDEPVPKNFQTNAVIYRTTEETLPGQEPELEEVTRGEIRLNQPVTFDGYALYQAGTQLEAEYDSMSFDVQLNDEVLGEFTFYSDEAPPEFHLEESDIMVSVDDWYPELEFTENGPSSFSKFPRNPGLIFSVENPDTGDSERFFYLQEDIIPLSEDNELVMNVTGVDRRSASGLTVKKDNTLPLFGLGAGIFMIGVVQGLYWYHRRVWIHPKGEGVYHIGVHTNKNWYGMKQELEKITEDTNVQEFEDQQELK